MWKAGYTERAGAKASSATLGRKPGSVCPRAGVAFFCYIGCYTRFLVQILVPIAVPIVRRITC